MPIVAKHRKNHFLSIYGPFSSIFSASPTGELLDKSRLAPFSGPCAPLKNGENGENGRSGVHGVGRGFALKQIKITAMTVFVTDIPVRLMRRHGSGDVAGSVKNAILKLETDAGIIGWGDAAPWAVFTGTIEANVAALHIYLRPLLVGADPFRIEALMAEADHAVVGHPEAKAAMEMALFDIVGQASGLPVAELLGGRCRDDIPLSFSVADPDVDRDMAMVQRLYGEGLRLFKMKTGFAGHAADLKRMERFRKELPADADLRIDYNQGMVTHDAIRQLRDV